MDGFRQGKVPNSVIKRMYGNQVLAEELNKMIQQELGKFLEENKIDILGDPLPKEDEQNDVDINNPSTYEFAFELGLAPEFDLTVLEGKPEFTLHEIKPEDAQIDEEIERLQKQNGNMTNPEGQVEEGDVLYCALSEAKGDGTLIEEGVSNETPIGLDMIKDEKIKKKLLKLKKGDTLVIDLVKTIDRSEHDIAHHILGLKEHNLDGLSKDFLLELKKINRVEPAELSQELYDKAFGPGKVNNLDEARAKIGEELSAYFKKDTNRKLDADIVDKMLEETKMDFPEAFLKKWIKKTNEKEITDEQIEEEFGYFARNLKWSLIVKRIGKEQELKVEPDEMRAWIQNNILSQYGIQVSDQFPQEAVDNMVNEVLKNQEQLKRAYDTLMEEKLFGWIKTQVTIKEKQVSLDEYKEIIKPKDK